MTLQRFQGCLVGLAIGDALGAPYEFKKPPFPTAREFRTGVFGTKPGHPTDDSTLAAACADALIRRGVFLEKDYADRVVDFANSNPPDIGGQTLHAAQTWWRTGKPPSETESAGNGALMAVAPIGLAYAYTKVAHRVGAQFSNVTHPNDESRAACAHMAGTIAALVNPEARIPLWASPYVRVQSARDDAASKVMGWAPLTLTLALDCLRSTDKPEQAVDSLMDLIRLGGDTDTNACVAGALLGARFGLAAWPHELRDTLHGYDVWLQRGADLLALAESFVR